MIGPDDLPDLYFRRRETGALVFRVSYDEVRARLDLTPLAVVFLDRDEIRPRGSAVLSETEIAQIAAWRDRQRAGGGDAPGAAAAAEINRIAQWVQSEATDEEIREAADPLFWAMHDLREVLLRKASRAKG